MFEEFEHFFNISCSKANSENNDALKVFRENIKVRSLVVAYIGYFVKRKYQNGRR